ncbi:MAG: hypothetical protein IPJ05_10930 [Nitrosomonas sp.]|nr:hypothetical protein [Nitrosomonas sp.]
MSSSAWDAGFFLADVHTPQRMANTFCLRLIDELVLLDRRKLPHISGQRDHVDLRRRFVTGLLGIGFYPACPLAPQTCCRLCY